MVAELVRAVTERRAMLVLRIMAPVRSLLKRLEKNRESAGCSAIQRQKKAQPQGLRLNPPKEEVLEETSDWHPT
jgi:hypothetical protein